MCQGNWIRFRRRGSNALGMENIDHLYYVLFLELMELMEVEKFTRQYIAIDNYTIGE
jgi:hypothetical protein